MVEPDCPVCQKPVDELHEALDSCPLDNLDGPDRKRELVPACPRCGGAMGNVCEECGFCEAQACKSCGGKGRGDGLKCLACGGTGSTSPSPPNPDA